VRRVGLGKDHNLFRMASDILGYFLMALWRTLALQSSMAPLLSQNQSTCGRRHDKKVLAQMKKLLSLNFGFDTEIP
jgi:hypothetical protein